MGFLSSLMLRANFYLLNIVMAAYCMTRFHASVSVAGVAVGVFTIGCLIARFLGGPAVDKFGLKNITYVGFAAVFVASALGLFGLIFTLLIGKEEPEAQREADMMMDDMALEANAQPVDFSETQATKSPAAKEPGTMRRMVNKSLELSVLPVGFVVFISYLAYGAICSYLDPFSVQLHLTSVGQYFFVVYALAMLVTRPLTAKLLDHRGPAPLMLPGFAVLAVGVGMLGIAPNAETLLIAAALIGCGIGAIQPTGLAMATAHMPKERFTVANGTSYMMTDIACGISPIIFGPVVSAIGYRGMYTVLIAVCIVGAAVFAVLHKKGRV
ncbi:MFS transporter [Bifidobacterium magnum]|nr:MFS transporter [Bifidobacterium magnum]